MPTSRRTQTLAIALVLAACQHTPVVRAPAEDPTPSGSAALRAYKESHYREIGSSVAAELDWERLLATIASQRVVFLGDHHRDRRLHAVHRELLRRLLERGARLALGVECVGSQDQPALDAWLDGRIDDATLRRAIAMRWPDSWLDSRDVDSAHYRELLQLARVQRVPIRALEPAPRLPLEQRDAVLADAVRRLLDAEPYSTVVVIVGHAHLLGNGDLVGRIGVPAAVLVARPSNSLAAWLASHPPTQPFVQTERGVLLPTFVAGEPRAPSRPTD
ncbi:MAG: ChaN family lipoprotein [Planctomycetes bacterium]|nr:ChaN family lipoprotein [Planctomycetota bacterium]